MFTGIIESLGKIISIQQEGSNKRFTIESSISTELKPGESVSHDGVCLTIEKTENNSHTVTAVDETLIRSNLGRKVIGNFINLERSMMMNGRIDGHLVQGHVDDVAVCKKIKSKDGSLIFTFSFEKKYSVLLIDKGSVCVNGVSLTVIKPSAKKFSVAVIPFTSDHTNFKYIEIGDEANIEFDVIGKYVARQLGRK